MKKKFIIEGLDCANCAAKLEDALNKSEYIDEASVSFISQKITLNASEENMAAAIEAMYSIQRKHFPEANISEK